MAQSARERTMSLSEEKTVTEFVSQTIQNLFNAETFVFKLAQSKTVTLQSEGQHFLFVGEKANIDQWAAGTDESIPAAIASCKAFQALCANSAGEGKLVSTYTSTGHRVSVGQLAAKVSRTNTPCRPDQLTAFLRGARGDSAKGVKQFIVTVAHEKLSAVAVAAGVARGASVPFTAKGTNFETGFGGTEGIVFTTFLHALLKSNNATSIAAFEQKLATIARSVQFGMRICEAPTSLVDTTTLPEIAILACQEIEKKKWPATGKPTITFDLIRGEELRERGYGGLYGVGKAAEFPPALLTMHYKPSATAATAYHNPLESEQPQTLLKRKIALVGKGLVYDTGGLSIKNPYTVMCGMKRDMGGSAGVLSGFLAAIAEQTAHEVTCTLCCADNAIGPRAQRPDDILRMKSGVTVELNNTDAEGRLALGDGVYHASKLIPNFSPPDAIIEMATLTGAQMIGVGRRHSGLYCNAETWEDKTYKAGLCSGDTCFPIVYAPEYHIPEFASKVADHKNLMAQTANAGISCAAAFVELNLDKDYKGAFVHLDIAGTANDDAWGATGWGAPLLSQMLLFDGLKF